MKNSTILFVCSILFLSFSQAKTLICETKETQEKFEYSPQSKEIVGPWIFHGDELHQDDGKWVDHFSPEHAHPQYFDWNESYMDGTSIYFDNATMTTGQLHNDVVGLPLGQFNITCSPKTERNQVPQGKDCRGSLNSQLISWILKDRHGDTSCTVDRIHQVKDVNIKLERKGSGVYMGTATLSGGCIGNMLIVANESKCSLTQALFRSFN